MSLYTTEVRTICEHFAGADRSGYGKVDDIITKAIPFVFNFDFPIFDEAYRPVLCKKILKHYYTREICCETVGRWQLFLDERLNRIMPLYNKMYEAETWQFDPLIDTDIKTEHLAHGSRTENGSAERERELSLNQARTENGVLSSESEQTVQQSNTNNGQSNGSTARVNKYSDTPQGSIQDLEDDRYLTNATIENTNNNASQSNTEVLNGTTNSNRNDTTSNTQTMMQGVNENQNDTTTSNTNTTEDYINRTFGKSSGKSYIELVKEYRKSLINIDELIIKELNDLFFDLW